MITGKFTTSSGMNIINSNVVLTVNGVRFNVKTDANGVYSYSYKSNIVGVNNVTVSYGGNAYFNPFSVKGTFRVTA